MNNMSRLLSKVRSPPRPETVGDEYSSLLPVVGRGGRGIEFMLSSE